VRVMQQRPLELPWLPPASRCLLVCKRSQIQHVMVKVGRAGAPPQFRFQLVSDSARRQVSLQRTSAPFSGSYSQFFIGQCFRLHI